MLLLNSKFVFCSAEKSSVFSTVGGDVTGGDNACDGGDAFVSSIDGPTLFVSVSFCICETSLALFKFE